MMRQLSLISMVVVTCGMCVPRASAQEGGAPVPVDLLVNEDALAALERAREAAAADRHPEAIRWYRRAIALHPALAREIGKELGHQYTWNDQPDSARIWYQAHLLDRPGDSEAKVGLGRLAAWNDDHDRAIAMYDEVLREHPDDLDAQLLRAQALNWASRHRAAAEGYRAILANHPDHAQAREGLARAYYWMGRPDLARAVIADGERTEALAALERDVDNGRAFSAGYTYDQNDDTDDIERRRHIVRAGVGLGDFTRVGAEYTHGTLEQPGRPEVERNAIAFILQRRFNEIVALTAALGGQRNEWDGGEFDLFTADTYLTLTPGDRLRMDAGLFRGALDNPDAIFNDIDVTQISYGVDWRLRSNLMWASALEYSWYSDDNTRLGGATRLVWQPVWRLPVPVRHRFTSTTGIGAFGFEETNDNGYYDPRQYLSIYQELAVDLTFSSRVRARVAGRLGLDKENGDDWFDTGRFEASASLGIARGFGVGAGFYNSTSRLDSREGYAADGFYISLDYTHLK